MKDIVITNFYGYQNIGDAAILEVAVKTINKAFIKKRIHIHTATKFVKRINNNNYTKLYLHPYGVAIKTSKGPISDMKKMQRFVTVISISLFYGFLGKMLPHSLPENGDYSYIKSLKDADIVLGIGGGYLRTKNTYRDYFGLLLTLLPIFITHLYNKRILYLPMSYGNFASSIHEKIVFHSIKNDVIIFRDEISLREFAKHTDKQYAPYLIPDLAIFDTYEDTFKGKKDYIVLTARLWMDEGKQKKYEQELALFIHYMWERYQMKTVFIPMVWNKNEDDDNRVGKRIQALVANNIVFTIVAPNTPLQVKKILSKAELAVCTRMHSAILSTIVKTPFITIAYEHKTVGFLKHLGLEDWNIDIESVSTYLLQRKVDDLFENKYKQFTQKLKKRHTEIMKREDELIEIVSNFRSLN